MAIVPTLDFGLIDPNTSKYTLLAFIMQNMDLKIKLEEVLLTKYAIKLPTKPAPFDPTWTEFFPKLNSEPPEH